LGKRLLISFFFISLTVVSFCQTRFSIATDLGLQRSFKKGQQYWAGGHTIQGQFHFTPKEGAYIWVSYYTNGKFKNDVMATAKSTTILPQQINFVNSAVMRFKQISIGWKKYLKGRSDAEDGWNLYGYAGFGLIMGRVDNVHLPSINLADYNVSVAPGKANFKRLTVDVGLGGEIALGADIYFYAEGRAWIPTSGYPSKYIFVNNNAPLVGMINAGIRILF
jgi:hypothetical protein